MTGDCRVTNFRNEKKGATDLVAPFFAWPERDGYAAFFSFTTRSIVKSTEWGRIDIVRIAGGPTSIKTRHRSELDIDQNSPSMTSFEARVPRAPHKP